MLMSGGTGTTAVIRELHAKGETGHTTLINFIAGREGGFHHAILRNGRVACNIENWKGC